MALIGLTIEEQLWNYGKSKGMNDYGIAGWMGNLFAESGLISINLQNTFNKRFNMTDQEYTDAVDRGTYTNFVHDSAGYGLCQWTYWSRKEGLLNFAKSRKVSIGDTEMQLDYNYKELSENYPAVLTVLRNAISVLEASNAMLIDYERPASQSKDASDEVRFKAQRDRANYSQKYYDKFVGSSKGVVSTKYNANNKPLQCMMTQSTCYKGTRKMEVKGVLWHSTGANNPNLKRYVQPDDNASNRKELLALIGTNQSKNDWNHINREAGLNCWIGKLADGTVTTVQTMPWDYRPWGCGSGSKGSCNTGWIQFEICEDALNDTSYFNAVYKEACEITAYLCKLYNIDPHGTVTVNGVKVPTILCHQDSYKLGMGSNHGDVLHWFSKFGKTMNDVRNDVSALMNGSGSTSDETSVNYQVKVATNDGLNCRTTYNTSGSIVTTYAKGTILTVLKECNGWGFVGAGWISLSYVERISEIAKEDEDMDVSRFKELWAEMRKELQDNDAGTYSAEARKWAIATGLIAGNGTEINGEPNCMWQDLLTREQFITVLYRFAQIMGKV